MIPGALTRLITWSNNRLPEAYGGSPMMQEDLRGLLDWIPSKATCDVIQERLRQVSVEGWNHAHDDEHDDGELAIAAAAYAVVSTNRNSSLSQASKLFAQTKWWKGWWKPKTPREDLVRAGALILAEIERLDRAAIQQSQGPST